jgi:hypothetical protein
VPIDLCSRELKNCVKPETLRNGMVGNPSHNTPTLIYSELSMQLSLHILRSTEGIQWHEPQTDKDIVIFD